MKREQIGQFLIKEGKISEKDLKHALEEQKKSRERLGAILIKDGLVKEKDILNVLSHQYNIPVESLSGQKIDENASNKIPAKFAYQYKIVPVRQDKNHLIVAVTDPLDLHALDDLRLLLECEVKAVLCPEKEIMKALKNLYGIGAETMEQMTGKDSKTVIGDQYSVKAEDKTKISDDTEDASIISFVNQIIREAFNDRATDIHIEPFEDELFVRYRVDGILHDIPTPATIKNFQSAIISRIKIMADMNIAEKRLPQDGRIQFKIDPARTFSSSGSGAGIETIDLRVSTLPILHGESIDLRILPRSQMHFGLEQLGMPESYLQVIESLIRKPHGILLVTGPTGHGKTTTLYACLSKINTPEKKIITVEDPVEYQLKRVNQVPVYSKIGLTFANGLRSILRQDPDVIMVGEIRDQETAEIAIRSSLTGHLVFSTLHTNDAPGAITRLIDMGIEPYLVSSSIEAVLAQRLIRLLCPKCKVADNDQLRIKNYELNNNTIFKAGAGCEECRHTGYKGRTGIYELLILDDDLRHTILEKTSSGNIKKEAISKGMTTLRQDGFKKVKAGLTTIEEVLRVTQEEAL